MNDKITLQAISDLFATQFGISKKTSDIFGKAFFDTIVDGLNKDGVVRIQGLGTFKIVEVGSRESVNVTNGERILIEGYRKVAFVADEITETMQIEAETQLQETPQPEISVISTEEPMPEVPADEFSAIDLLISTPESINEINITPASPIIMEEEKKEPVMSEPIVVQQSREEAVPESPEAVEPKTVEPMVVEPAPAVEPTSAVEPAPVDEPTPDVQPVAALASSNNDNLTSPEPDDDDDEDNDLSRWFLVALAAILLVTVFVCGYKYVNGEDLDDELHRKDIHTVAKEKEYADSLAEAKEIFLRDSIAEAESKAAAERIRKEREAKEEAERIAEAKKLEEAKAARERAAAEKAAAEKAAKDAEAKRIAQQGTGKPTRKMPASHTHVLKQGEGIYQLARDYYGSNTYAKEIIRINNFQDPNNIPIGTVVKLP